MYRQMLFHLNIDKYVDCDRDSMQAEEYLLDLLEVEIGHMTSGSCVQIFDKLPPPNDNSGMCMRIKVFIFIHIYMGVSLCLCV